MSKSKRKGTAGETAVVTALQEEGYPHVERRALAGVNDKGDVAGLPVVVEVKNHKAMALAEWVDEANVEAENAGVEVGVVWHKRVGRGDPRRWYVSMDGERFLKLLRAYTECHR